MNRWLEIRTEINKNKPPKQKPIKKKKNQTKPPPPLPPPLHRNLKATKPKPTTNNKK